MLKLQNVCKKYVTKSKVETEALADVNLEIGDCGMVFVLGKSGSGKSTLLNLLGGLDSPTSGEIFVDGASMRQFSPRDYANYRNNYVGFIFQEFNLLADFNVRDNVALALKLSKSDNADGKVSEALKQVELDDSYLFRKIGEMSGGEKQRIAIARALIKDSKLILADEPTGNLDSATGESIWNILKNLSRDRLVVVVSHDRDSAEKYADRTIEIADGRVVSDVGAQPVALTEEKAAAAVNTKTAAKGGLSFLTCLKMGFNNLRKRKIKTISTILVAIFSIFSLVFMQMCMSFSPEEALADYIIENNVEHFFVAQGYSNPDTGLFSFGKGTNYLFDSGTKKHIADNSRNMIGRVGTVESKQDILDFGFTFVGDALELDDNSFYITSYQLERYYMGNGQVEIDGRYVAILKGYHPIEFLVGKKIKDYIVEDGGVLAGVVDVDSMVYPEFPHHFCNKNFVRSGYSKFYYNDGSLKDMVMYFGDGQYDGKMKISEPEKFYLSLNCRIVLTEDGICSDEKELNLADNEIVLPYEIYAKLFDAPSKWYCVSEDVSEVLNIPKEIGQTFSLKFSKYGADEIYADYGEVKLAGISFTVDWSITGKDSIWTSDSFLRQMQKDLGESKRYLVQTSSVQDLHKFATTLRREYDGCIDFVGEISASKPLPNGYEVVDVSWMVYCFESTIKSTADIFLIMAVLSSVVLVLLVINLISVSIANRRREIGILTAIGATNRDITGIFLLETLIISAITFVVVFAASFVAVRVYNVHRSGVELLSVVFPFLRVSVLTVAISVVASFGLLLLAALIPLGKITKLKPIDAIRN